MRIVVIGGTGHIGSYLIPRLVGAGHDVVVASRGHRHPYHPHNAWTTVPRVEIDRAAEEGAGTFGKRIAALQADAVVDLICFTVESARQLVDALGRSETFLLHCGTIWVHGHSTIVPTVESQTRHPFGEYGTQKAAIECYLVDGARDGGLRAAVLHPGHIVGPGWAPLNPCGHFNPAVFTRLAHGETVTLPNLGMETVHHVHADDVAQLFELALNNPERSVGESFHAVSAAALTLRGYAEAMADHFGQPPDLRFAPWTEWRGTVSDAEANATWDHIAHSPNCSMAKARELLGYAPRYTSLAAVIESVGWLINEGLVHAYAGD